MIDSILPNERKWELPTGRLIRFDSKDDLEYFIRQCNFSYDEVLNCIPGVTCEIDDPCEINLDYDNDNEVLNYLSEIYRLDAYKDRVEDEIDEVFEHYKYNRKLVELSKTEIPEDIMNKMNQYNPPL